MNTFQLSGEPRQDTGKKATKADRAKGLIPCVAYGQGDAKHFTVTLSDVRKLVFTPSFNVVDLTLNGADQRAILKDVQYHPTTEDIEHMDFLLVEAGHAVKVELPLRTVGVSPGVKGGGRLIQSVRTVKVKTLPGALVDELTVDIGKLELGEAVRVRDIAVPEGVQIMSNGAIPVAMVEIPRALRSAATAAAKEAGGPGAKKPAAGAAKAPAAAAAAKK